QCSFTAAGLPGDGDSGGTVAGSRNQRVEVHDGPCPADSLPDVRADPARATGVFAVAELHGGGGHAARDRAQRLALHVRFQAQPVPRQRFAEQGELVAGGLGEVDTDVPVVFGDRFDPLHEQVVGGGGHDEPVPAVHERQPLFRDAVLQHAGGVDLL